MKEYNLKKVIRLGTALSAYGYLQMHTSDVFVVVPDNNGGKEVQKLFEEHTKTVHVMSATAAPYALQSITPLDIVCCIGVFMYLKEEIARSIIKQSWDALRPRGLFVFEQTAPEILDYTYEQGFSLSAPPCEQSCKPENPYFIFKKV